MRPEVPKDSHGIGMGGLAQDVMRNVPGNVNMALCDAQVNKDHGEAKVE